MHSARQSQAQGVRDARSGDARRLHSPGRAVSAGLLYSMTAKRTLGHADSAATLIFGKVLAALADAATPIILVRLLPKEDVGVILALFVVYATVSLFFLIGLPNAVLYYLPSRSAGERRAIARLTTGALFGLGVLTGALLLLLPLLGQQFPALLRPFAAGGGAGVVTGGAGIGLFALLALLPLGDVPARLLPNLLVIEGRTRAAAWFGIGLSLARTLACVVPPLVGLGVVAIVASLAVTGLVSLAVVVAVLGVLYRDAPRQSSPVSLAEILRFGLPLGLTDLVSGLNGSVDRYLVMFAFTPRDFAEYQAAAWQIPIVTAIAYTVGTACAPRFTEMFKSGRPEEAVELWRRATVKVSLVVVPVSLVFVIAAEETLQLLFTADYLRGATVFRYYGLITLGRVAAFGTLLLCAGRPRLILLSALGALVASVACGVPLLALFGFEGPAAGAFLAYVVTVAIYCRAIAAAAGLSWRRIFPLLQFSRVLAVSLAAGLPALVFKLKAGLPPLATIGGVAAITIGGFLALGTIAGVVHREDWRRIAHWSRLGFLRGG